jgi:hypothetical protein
VTLRVTKRCLEARRRLLEKFSRARRKKLRESNHSPAHEPNHTRVHFLGRVAPGDSHTPRNSEETLIRVSYRFPHNS